MPRLTIVPGKRAVGPALASCLEHGLPATSDDWFAPKHVVASDPARLMHLVDALSSLSQSTDPDCSIDIIIE